MLPDRFFSGLLSLTVRSMHLRWTSMPISQLAGEADLRVRLFSQTHCQKAWWNVHGGQKLYKPLPIYQRTIKIRQLRYIFSPNLNVKRTLVYKLIFNILCLTMGSPGQKM